MLLLQGDIPRGWWHRFWDHFVVPYAEKCQVGGERGKTNRNFHMQVFVEMHSARDKDPVLAELKKWINKSLLIMPNDGQQICIRRVDEADGTKFMLGYVQKDRGFSHYVERSLGYTDEEKKEAREFYSAKHHSPLTR